MIATPHEWNGTAVTIFQMSKGETIAPGRHQHPWAHSTGVAAGRTQVTIFTDDPHIVVMKPRMRDLDLPANVDHEITALEDGTIVVQMMQVQNPATPSKPGGIAQLDGTVVYGA